ncbi:MAG: sodium:solute symporter [bacterium]
MVTMVVLGYLGIVLLIGILGHRLFRGTGEDYFVASRTIGPFVLLMTLFGTNMTAFSILGASGESYHEGIGVFALMGSSSALVIPFLMYFLGTRLWALGKKYGYITQVQFFRERYSSDGLGLLLFIVLTLLMIPYLLIGVLGGGLALHDITAGQIPAWLGKVLVCTVIFIYVSYGGMRSTSWVNTFQTLVFMTLGATAFFVITNKFGGVAGGMQRVAESHPDLLSLGGHIKPLKLLTYTCLPLSLGMFPHVFMHWLTAKRLRAFRQSIALYPLCIAVVWVPSVVLGVLGTIDYPDLAGPAANTILVKLFGLYASDTLGGLLAAGVLAAIMSSLDSQVLAVGTMFSKDIIFHYGFHDKLSEKQQVVIGRSFVLLVLLCIFLISQVLNRSIFKIAIWSFTGFAALLPIIVAALFWTRSTKWGAIASVATTVLLWLTFFVHGWTIPDYTIGDTGVMPVALMVGVSAVVLVVVSVLTSPPDATTIAKFFPNHVARVDSATN